MNCLHYEYSNIGPDDVLEITLNGEAKVQLLDDENYQRYAAEAPYTALGGVIKTSPCPLSPPRFGKWHLVIDFPSHAAQATASVRVIQFSGHSLPSVRPSTNLVYS